MQSHTITEKNQVQHHKTDQKLIKFMLDQTKMKTSQNRAYHTQNRANRHNQHVKNVRACKYNQNA